MARRTVVLHASGHSQVRATHAKSIELTSATEITPRATCVAGVGMARDEAIGLLRGPVSVTLKVNGKCAHGWGVINPHHAVDDRVVLRRAAGGGPETLVVRSTLTAAKLDRGLVGELSAPGGAEVTLTIEEEPSAPSGDVRQALVLVSSRNAWPLAGRLAELWDHADVSLDLRRKTTTDAADVMGERGVLAVTLPEAGLACADPHPAVRALIASVSAASDVSVASLDGNTLLEVLLASGLPPVPVRWLGRVSRAAARERQVAPEAVPTVLAVAREDAEAVLGKLAGTHPRHPVAVQGAVLEVGIAVTWLAAGEALKAVANHPGEAPLLVIAPLETGQAAGLHAIAWALMDAGVPPRTIGDSLAPFGLDRRALYAGMSPKDK